MKIFKEKIYKALNSLNWDEFKNLDIATSKAINIKIAENDNNSQDLDILITFYYPAHNRFVETKTCISNILEQSEYNYSLNLKIIIRHHLVQSGCKGIPNIKNIIAIGSGKGGVGKSTISVNLARALNDLGAKVGLLDADIYGPSLPTMLAVEDRPSSPDGKSMTPINVDGIETMSIGYLIEHDTPMIWRGPIVTNTLQQLLNETNWGDLDYLIVDLPPGTGDTQLTLAQKIPVAGSIVVTTPQNVALADARKAIRMFEKVNINIIGIVENMSYFICPNCHEKHIIYKNNSTEAINEQYNINKLTEIPLNTTLTDTMDRGKAIAKIDNEIYQYFLQLASNTTRLLSEQPIDFTAKLPSVEITNLTSPAS